MTSVPNGNGLWRSLGKRLLPFRTSLLGLLVLLPLFGTLHAFHDAAERHQRDVLYRWNRTDFDLLSVTRAIHVLPLPTLFSEAPLSPTDLRRLQGWIVQSRVALQDLEKSRPLLNRFQTSELDRLEALFRTLKTVLSPVLVPKTFPQGHAKAGPSLDFMSVWTLERQMKMTIIALSLSVRTSRETAQKNLYGLETNAERAYGGLLLAFLALLIVLDRRELTRARKNVAARESELRALFDAMTDAVVYADVRRTVRFVNPAVLPVFGYLPDELVGQSAAIFYARFDDFEEQGRLRYHPDAPDSEECYEMAYRRKDGSVFTGEAHGALVRDPEGQVRGFMVTIRDVTQRKQMLDSLFREKEKWFVTLGSIGDAVITTDVRARVEYMNPVAESLTGWPLSEAAGRPVSDVFDIINEITRNPPESPVEKSLRQGTVVGLANHTVLRHRAGIEYAIEDSAAPIRDSTEHIIGCVIVFRDITQKRNLLRQVTRQANFDALTDLPNRYLFQDRLAQAIAQAHRHGHLVALLYLDLDHFKKINDTQGHPFGDRVLQETARRLRAVVRESDTVARLGGDEFTILAGDIGNRDNVSLFAQKVLEAIARPMSVDGQESFLTVSIGVAVYPDDGTTTTALVRNADIAMYQAKEKGRNTLQFFSPAMNVRLRERMSLENHLHNAMEREEFQLVYQPILDLALGKTVAVEALIRWHHPQQGVIPPNRFIPMAEENGLILPLGEWVLETACRQAQEWREQGMPPLRLTVNVSIRQLMHGDLPKQVERCLHLTGLAPNLLELELTESVFLQNTEKVLESLADLRRLGVRLSIDDFGTGYSSLSYLSHFHVHTLKIDGSFIEGIGTHPTNTAIVTAILTLANAMSLEVVAEGVETVDQYRFLKDQGCPLGQGYFFSKPVCPSEIPDILARGFDPGGT